MKLMNHIKPGNIIIFTFLIIPFTIICGCSEMMEEMDEPGTTGGRYSVTYNPGTGTTGTVPVDISVYEKNETVTVLDNTGVLAGPLIQDGIRQRFVEWNTASNGSGTSYAPGATFAITQNETLFAVYTADSGVIRKVGPAGGWIFYDAGSTQPWGQYLEAANEDLADAIWGTVNLTVPGADGTDIGTGRQNTTDIIAGDTATNKAADRCRSYSVDYNGSTYSDWFLPSIEEFNELYRELYEYGAGGVFMTALSYWSSTEVNNTHSRSIVFTYGTNHDGYKTNSRHIRPVRAF